MERDPARSVQQTLQRSRELLEAHPVGRVISRGATGLAQIELVDRSMTLAAQMFTSVLPVLLAWSTVMGTPLFASSLIDRFGLAGTLGTVDEYQLNAGASAFGIAGLAMVVISGTSFARALARMYGKVWKTGTLGPTQAWRWCAVLLIVAASIVVAGFVHLTEFPVLAMVGQWCLWVCVWTACPYLLTLGAVPARTLWTTGIITATLLAILDAGSAIAMPLAVASSAAHFGVMGVVFTGIGWLFFAAVMLVTAPVIANAFLPPEPN